ncbi:MAG: UDP-glucose/GDP-mannose dehydrogenase family protein [Candidatus Korobacteraceae bacterium]
MTNDCPSVRAPVRIAVIGSGYVGLVAAACLAEIGHSVTCVDSDDVKIADLQNGLVPIHEDLLPELLARVSGKQLRFSTDLSTAIREADVIFIAVGTPSLESGDADLSYVESVAAEIARSINGYKVIVEKSTVPVYTNEWVKRVLVRNGVRTDSFDVVSNPEFLREGAAVLDFLHPDRIVVGADTERSYSLLARIYEPLTCGSYYRGSTSLRGRRSAENPVPMLRTSAKSAELIKHACNAFLAMKVSFINSVANVCEAVGADISEVAEGIGQDSRIGPQFLSAGIGYGGSCFPKDLKAFCSVGSEVGVDLKLLHEVETINTQQQKRFLAKIRSALWTLKGKRLGALGLAFKGGTDDLRESPAVKIVEALLTEGSSVTAYDPAAMSNAQAIFGDRVRLVRDSYAAAEGADALIILTDWKEFAELDLERLKLLLRYPIIVDGRNLYRPEEVTRYGFTYVSVGRSTANPTSEIADPAATNLRKAQVI